MGAAVAARGPAHPPCGCGAAPGRCGCANKGCGCGAPAGGCGCARGAKAAPGNKAEAPHPQRPPRGTPQTAARRDDGPRQAKRSAQPEVPGDESAAAARRRAFIEQELPELWPTQESMDEAAALRALARRLSAQLEAHDKRPTPMQVPRGTPSPVIERGQMPRPEPVDCGVGLKAPRFGLRSGPLRQGRMPKRPRKVVTYIFPRLRGGMQVEDGELLTGLRSLRGALARGLVPQIDLPSARKPVMMEGPPAPPPMSGVELDGGFGRPGMIDLRAGRGALPPSLRLRYRGTAVHLPLTWAYGYLLEYIETRGTVPPANCDGPVSGRGYVMDVFWPRFRERARALRARRGAYGHLIGCWMLPIEGEAAMPTSLFFQGGGEQRMVHELTCQMLEAYLDVATVPQRLTSSLLPPVKVVNDGGWCDGLADFIGAMLRQEPARALRLGALAPEAAAGEPCADARLHYVSSTGAAGLDVEWTPPCGSLGRPYGRRAHLCSEVATATTDSLDGAFLPAWDDYSLELRSARFNGSRRIGSYVWFADEVNPRSDTTPWPSGDTTVTATGSHSYRCINLQAAHLAFDGELADLLMFMAQVCLDYARHVFAGRSVGSSALANEVFEAGRRFAGYALSLIAERAGLLVHEFGHVYLGGTPHCGFDIGGSGSPRWRSCFDVARRHFWAQVVAENGLAAKTYTGAVEGPLGSDPDFGTTRSGDAFFVMANPIWRFGTGTTCERLESGDEDPESTEEGWVGVNLSASACVGNVAITFLSVGEPGGGYRFDVTDGCQCSVGSTAVPDGVPDERSFNDDGPCFDDFVYAMGTYYVAST